MPIDFNKSIEHVNIMKSPTMSAMEHLADALDSISKAQKAIRVNTQFYPDWFLIETIGRITYAKNRVEEAGAYVQELYEIETDGDTSNLTILDSDKSD